LFLVALTGSLVTANPSTALESKGRLLVSGVWEHNAAQLFVDGQTLDSNKAGTAIRFERISNLTLAKNRLHDLWQRAAKEFVSWALATFTQHGDPQQLNIVTERMQSLAFSYIDTHPIARGKSWVAADSLPKGISSVARLVSRKIVTDTVGDKRNFGRLAKQVGVEGTVVPRTFESAAEAIAALSSNSNLVFVKSTSGAGGKEVEPVATKNLSTFLELRGGLKPHELIQEGIEGLALHNGKKLVIRSHFVVHGGALYVSRVLVAIVHGLNFDTSIATHAVHVDHAHPDTQYGDLKDFTGDADNTKWFAAVVAAAQLAGPMFERVVRETAEDNLQYHVFGVDVLPRSTGDVMFVECNIFPNIPDFKHYNDLAASVLRLIYGVQKGDGTVDDDLTKVWTLPQTSLHGWETRGSRTEL
jgi:hypothetical protein